VITTQSLFLAADTAVLVGYIQPVLMVITFIPWAWLISSKLEKDAKYYHMNWTMWNSIHLGAGAAALVCVLAVPIFWIGWPVSIILLLSPILAYWNIRNKEVPENARFHLTTSGLRGAMEERKARAAAKGASMFFIDKQKKEIPVPLREDPMFEVYMRAEEILGPALASRATKIEVASAAGGAAVSQTIDGMRYKRDPMPVDAAGKVIDFLKSVSGLDVEDRRRRQSGEFKLKLPGSEHVVTIAVNGSSAGQSMRLDIDRTSRISKTFESLGLLPPQLEWLKVYEQNHERHGVILLGAPIGHGLTTMGYAFLSRHDAFTSNIKTLERQIELRLDGVDHTQFDPSNPAVDYATNLQSILRRDPDIVLVSDVKEPNSGKVAATPGIQGPLLYVLQQHDSAPAQIQEWFKSVGDLKLAAKGLRAVVNQRLVRALCPHCKQAFSPSAEQARTLNLPAGKTHQLFRAGGKVQVKNKIENCPVCLGTGYLGQTGIYEVMILDDEARKLLSAGDLKGAYAHARRNKMIYLQEAALLKVRNGDTTLEEVARVTAPAASAPSQAAPAGASA
jgi:type II secretory ATPase GspE/PulE/Tfp pilus assembly ATPase PilB-like protein